MKKIPTIFKRDFSKKGKGRITRDLDITRFDEEGFSFVKAVATEKIDGTNVRLTVSDHKLVQVEKRKNITRTEELAGLEPGYVLASDSAPEDQYIIDAAKNTDLSEVPDGQWSGEAIGPKIQGNPLELVERTVFLFSVESILMRVQLFGVPTNFEELERFLPECESVYSPGHKVEGIVWHHTNGSMAKIKTKDFK